VGRFGQVGRGAAVAGFVGLRVETPSSSIARLAFASYGARPQVTDELDRRVRNRKGGVEMSKVLIAFQSVEGHTEQLAEFIAEGVRMKGHQAVLKKVTELKTVEDVQGHDAYIFGCPTYHHDMTQGMKTFLFLAKKAGLEGKPGGAFGTYTHSGDAPSMILETMEHVFKMKVTSLGALNLLERHLDTGEGMKAGQDYGKAVVELI
jgi:flavodoxin